MDFRCAALARLADAEELLEPPTREPNRSDAERRHTPGAAYLAGYAVECSLKAYFISQRSPGKRGTLSGVSEDLSGEADLLSARGHSISLLLGYTDLEERTTDRQRRLLGTIAASWTTDLRYRGRGGDPARERVLVAGFREITEWIHRML